jgi:hypothetical protein
MLPSVDQEEPPGVPYLQWAFGFSPGFTDLWAEGSTAIEAPAESAFALLTHLNEWEGSFSSISRLRLMEPESGGDMDGEMACVLDGIPVRLRLAKVVPGSRLAWHGEGFDLGVYMEWVLATAQQRTQALLGIALRGPAAICLRQSEPHRLQACVDRWLADLKQALERP